MEFDSVESISTWSVYQVAHFVSQLVGTEIYSKLLKENNVNGKVLLNCNLEGWQQFGIHTLAHRAALYGWAQGRLIEYQDKVSMQRRISGESTNKARNTQLDKPTMIVSLDSKFANEGKTVKKMPAKAILKENFASQSRLCNDNMKSMREWFQNGAGRFSRHEFLTGNLKKNKELKAAIIDVIEEKKLSLLKVTIDGEPCAWTTDEIFTRVMTHRNYMKKPKLEVKGSESGAGDTSSNLHALSSGVKVVNVPENQNVYIPFMGEVEQVAFHDTSKIFEEGRCISESTTSSIKTTMLSVVMYGSPFFIPEQVIQFRHDRLVARKAAIEYRYLPEFDEGIIGFGVGALVRQDHLGPYEKWEVEVEDLAIGNGMKNLLLPGTNRAASTVRIGERLLLPAVYLLMSETVPNSESNHDEHNNEERNAFSRQEQAVSYDNQEDMEAFESHDFDIVKRDSHNLPTQNKGGNEAIEDIDLEADDITTMGLADRTITHNINAKNAEVEESNILTMRCTSGIAGTLVEKLLQEYHAIDMDTNLGTQATLCTKGAFKQNVVASINSKLQEAKTCPEVSQSVDKGSKKYMNINTCQRSTRKDVTSDVEMEEGLLMSLGSKPVENDAKEVNMSVCKATSMKRANMSVSGKNKRKKALKDITNSPLKNTIMHTSEKNSESYVSVTRGRHERPMKVPSRYRD